jgi:hypothetical protein
MHDQVMWTHDAPVPMVAVPVGAVGAAGVPEALRGQLTVDVIHDGDVLPRAFLVDGADKPIPKRVFYGAYIEERDWGASLVAERIAARLGLGHYHRVTTARCLLDFGRFPGVTGPSATHLRRFAINHPFSQILSWPQRRHLLEAHYDAISAEMDHAVRGRLLKIAVHTYDRMNPSGTERPQVSLVSRALGYQLESQMPVGVFDPLFPDILAEFTADRLLMDRISLTLQKEGVPVAHNYPYLLPEGSVEVRHQVWCFFDWLQSRFEEHAPDTAGDPAFALVWDLLKDTNLRSAAADSLRSFLHMFRHAPAGSERLFMAAERAYRRIERFLHADDGEVLARYRADPLRPMAFGIEIRKDLVWEFDENGHPLTPAPERALAVADLIADAILVYLYEDRPARLRHPGALRAAPWRPEAGGPGAHR